MSRALLKNFIREIRKTFTRFLSIFAICALGVAFFSGIRATSPNMKEAGDKLYSSEKLSDITVMSTSGLTGDDIEALRAIEGVEAVRPGMFVDAMVESALEEEKNIRFLSMPVKEKGKYPMLLDMLPSYDIDDAPAYEMNTLELTEGRLPVSDSEIVLDERLKQSLGVEVGDKLRAYTSGGSVTARITGFVFSPKYISLFERGTSSIGTGASDGFAYASGNLINKLGSKLPLIGLLETVYTSADIVVSGKEGMSSFEDEYKELVSEVMNRIEDYGTEDGGTWYVQDRSANPGYTDFSENTARIAAVGDVFPVIFFIVAALVCLTTMTRMVEEERIEMGTLKALGYSNGAIMAKYAVYAIGACVLGGLFGASVGFKLLPMVILSAYSIMYRMPYMATPYRAGLATTAIAVMALCSGAATLAASFAALREKPSALMRPKAPKAGKRVFLENIGFIWKKLNFTAKVTVRNLFRYKKRFFMSVIGIAGGCSLLVTGFGVKHSIFGIIDVQFGDIWNMDIQAYLYEAIPLEDIEELLDENEASDYIDSAMFCYDNTAEAGVGGNKMGGVHLLGVEDSGSMDGKISLHDGDTPLTLTSDGGIVTAKIAEKYSLEAGDTIKVYMGTHEYDVPVRGVADNYVNNYIYVTSDYYRELIGQEMKYNAVMLDLSGDMTDEKLEEITSMLLADQRMYTVKTLGSIYDSIIDSLSILDYIVIVLILGSAVLTFVVMLNLTNINIGERSRELATLRVLGFYDREMYDYIFRENNALAVIGAAFGLIFGKYMHAFVIRTCEVDLVMFVREAGTMSNIYSFALTIVFSIMVNLVMRRKVRSIDMVQSLKSAE